MNAAQRARRAVLARGSARGGFTLVELMIALLTGSIVLAGAYYMSETSSRIFSEQLRRSEAQMNIRAATELMRRDIGRAGYLAARSTFELLDANETQGAVGPLGTDVAPQAVTAVSVQLDANGRQELILTGNMSTGEHYFVTDSNGMNLLLRTVDEGYRRSFINPTDGLFMPQRFSEAFFPDPAAPGPGRMVSVTELSFGRLYLRNLAGMTNAPVLDLTTPLPLNPSTMNVQSIVVAPVSVIRYAMEIPGNHLGRVGGRTYTSGGRLDGRLKPVLVRTELNAATLQPILPTARVVLDSLVDGAAVAGFTVEAVWNNAHPLAMNLVHEPRPETLAPVNQGQIHSLIIQLALETEQPEGDDLSQRRARAARRIIRFEVMLPNAARNAGAMN